MRRLPLTLALIVFPACAPHARTEPPPDVPALDAFDAALDAPLDAPTDTPSAPRDVPTGAPPAIVDPPGPPRFDRAFRIATHNSYWVQRSPTPEPAASGTQHRLLDQLLFDHARAIELDVHRDRDNAGAFRVFHTSDENNSLCSPLRECARMLRAFHYALPDHEPVVVVIELKELSEHNFDETHTPADLDRTFTDLLTEPGDGGAHSWLYTPGDLLARCPAGTSLRDCVRTAGWPTTAEMRGRFVIAVLGNFRIDYTTTTCHLLHPQDPCLPRATDSVQGHGPADWVYYATWGGGAAQRAAFPMRSNWVAFNGGPDTETVPIAQLQAANEASVLEQVEDLTDPWIPWDLADGVVVRGHDSFSFSDQAARVGAGYALIQTDYPWHQFLDLGPSHPFRPLGPRDDLTDFTEPGKRIALHGPADTTRVAFASTEVHDPACVAWQTTVSITRPSPVDAYPPAQRPRGRGCLRVAADPHDGDADGVTLCRTTVAGEFAQITVESRVGGTSESHAVMSAARGAGGAGELLRMEVCPGDAGSTVRAYSASDVLASGEPDWVLVGGANLPGPLPYQGLAASGDVLFVGTRHGASFVSRYDLNAPVVLQSAGQSPSSDATLVDLSYPAPTPDCHDPRYPVGCNGP